MLSRDRKDATLKESQAGFIAVSSIKVSSAALDLALASTIFFSQEHCNLVLR
jgi:hypothetical protein